MLCAGQTTTARSLQLQSSLQLLLTPQLPVGFTSYDSYEARLTTMAPPFHSLVSQSRYLGLPRFTAITPAPPRLLRCPIKSHRHQGGERIGDENQAGSEAQHQSCSPQGLPISQLSRTPALSLSYSSPAPQLATATAPA